jgi:hypothetical protein
VFAGSYADYLSTVSRVHFWWSEQFFRQCASVNFPGITVLLLVGVALASRTVRTDQRAVMCVSVAVGCVLVSMVPRLPGYEHIHNLVPLFWAVRVQAHIGQIVLLALALLAGFGAWQLRQRWGSRRGAWGLALLLVFLINAEAFRAPIPWRVFEGIPPIYDVLAALPRAVVVELPAYDPRAVFGNARYMLFSTRYWHPLVNGYSGFAPESYGRAAAGLRGFPDIRALEMLRARSVTHVVVHQAAFVGHCGQAAFDSIARIGSLQEIAHEGDIRIYRFR